MRRFNKPQKNPSKTLLIICIAAVLMVCVDYANNYLNSKKAPPIDAPVVVNIEEASPQMDDVVKPFDERSSLVTDEIYMKLPQPEPVVNHLAEASEEEAPATVGEVPEQVPEQRADARLPIAPDGEAKLVIIIDDLGMSHKYSNQIIDMDAPLTFAFLPYAKNLEGMTERARSKGHELLIHMPMEPMNPDLDLGSIAIRTGMSEQEVKEQLRKAFNSFKGYVGINNHMGSRVTQDVEILNLVMTELAKRDLLFVDSKTIGGSIAAEVAKDHGLNYAVRDIFLDHEDGIEFVRASLKRVEETLSRKGMAIAIGHPKPATIQGLQEWIPTLEQKGITIVPVSQVVKNGFIEHTLQMDVASEALSAIEPAVGDQPETEPETDFEAMSSGRAPITFNGMVLDGVAIMPYPLKPGATFSAPAEQLSQPPE